MLSPLILIAEIRLRHTLRHFSYACRCAYAQRRQRQPPLLSCHFLNISSLILRLPRHYYQMPPFSRATFRRRHTPPSDGEPHYRRYRHDFLRYAFSPRRFSFYAADAAPPLIDFQLPPLIFFALSPFI
jgi:hypothetical protein